ncbi:hypothetical protein Taro_033018 [Colocasia esculenta]|uniref:Uncharacterized protein n=1 Tax=Colocasia esculenta TaxID=4460 RepID=A0A843VU68_COLES|nr:hypothetical protein [Colocasia esculenta]
MGVPSVRGESLPNQWRFHRLWGTFLADVVIQMLGTDYARVLRAIYAFAQFCLESVNGDRKYERVYTRGFLLSFGHIVNLGSAPASAELLCKFINLRLGRVSSKKHIHLSTISAIPESCSTGGENICI